MPAAAVKPAKETAVVTHAELFELAQWEKKFAKATADARNAEKELKFRRQQLAEKVLGISTSDDLKKLPPQKVEKLQAQRLEAGDWRPERNAPEFSFAKVSEGRYPSWAQLYAKELGETAAEKIRNDTPVQYSYRVEVAV